MKAIVTKNAEFGLIGLASVDEDKFYEYCRTYAPGDAESINAGILRLEHAENTAQLYKSYRLTPELPLVLVLKSERPQLTVAVDAMKKSLMEASLRAMHEKLEPDLIDAIGSLAREIWAAVTPGGTLVSRPDETALEPYWAKLDVLLRTSTGITNTLSSAIVLQVKTAFFKMWKVNAYEAMRTMDGADYLKRVIGLTFVAVR